MPATVNNTGTSVLGSQVLFENVGELVGLVLTTGSADFDQAPIGKWKLMAAFSSGVFPGSLVRVAGGDLYGDGLQFSPDVSGMTVVSDWVLEVDWYAPGLSWNVVADFSGVVGLPPGVSVAISGIGPFQPAIVTASGVTVPVAAGDFYLVTASRTFDLSPLSAGEFVLFYTPGAVISTVQYAIDGQGNSHNSFGPGFYFMICDAEGNIRLASW
jgi:hypothetical protein